MISPPAIRLTEYRRANIPRGAIPHELGERLWREHGERIAVEFPSPKSGDCWQLTSLGWVGVIPLTPEFRIVLQPKVHLRNLFGMIEYAHRLKGFRFLDGAFHCEEIEDFFSELAGILARRVIDRARRGLHMEYVQRSDRLPYLRGGLDIERLIRAPHAADIGCTYDESTVDIDDNRIIAWTLSTIARNGVCGPRLLPVIRRASSALEGLVETRPYLPRDCSGRRYTRLNEDYHPLHALCRFFLEHGGPTGNEGNHEMIPFLVDMARLFELFVAEWMMEHLPERFRLMAQENIPLGPGLRFRIDLVIYDAAANLPLMVIDTKYKTPRSPDAADVAQVVAYAEAKGCRDAILLYPSDLPEPLDCMIGSIRVRSMAFNLDGDLEEGGNDLLRSILPA
ncbi:MAG: 5-methylcytosine restriction system component-like protein [Chlorobi bacterium]|nr:5-methylcytosine restriction system component-like protein [Chlorobiota bacterium]